MTSIVITPFDPEHAPELASFIENELDNADFHNMDMPCAITIREQTSTVYLAIRLDGFTDIYAFATSEECSAFCEAHPDYEYHESCLMPLAEAMECKG